jgi:hypothetical protein
VITLASDGRCCAFQEWPFHPEQALSPPEDTLYDGELVDSELYKVREALTDELGEYCGGVWMSGRGETRRLNVAVTTRGSDAEAGRGGCDRGDGRTHRARRDSADVWSLAELQAGREHLLTRRSRGSHAA